MRKSTLLMFLSFFLTTTALLAQSGIRGTIKDNSNGELIPFADVYVEGTSTGTTSDLDGAFNIKLEPGTYTIICAFLGYTDTKIKDVVVQENAFTTLNIEIGEDVEELEEVVVTAKQVQSSDAAVQRLQKKSLNVLDGISSQSISKTGDSDAASAIKRVTGVSVQDGKYIYVRGLSDRYTKTTLNGLEVPSLDPDKNSVQLDIFPTNLIDNILVYKTYTPDLQADFTGGLVDIVTKDFPELFTSKLTFSYTYNPNWHFNSNAPTYKGSSTDFLGFDNGQRKLPFNPDKPLPYTGDPEMTKVTASLNPIMAATQRSLMPNMSLGYSIGNQINKEKYTWGYLGAFNYKMNNAFYEDVQYANWAVDYFNAPGGELFENNRSTGSYSTQSRLLSALFNTSIKFKANKIGLKLFRTQEGESKAGLFTYEDLYINRAILHRTVLGYAQRDVSSITLNGKHSIAQGRDEFTWSFGPTFSHIKEPDIRQVAFSEDPVDGTIGFQEGVGAVAERTWRDLEQTNWSGRMDYTHKVSWFGDRNSKLKAGLYAINKNRNYSIVGYNLKVRQKRTFDFSQMDPNIFLLPENVYQVESGRGTYLVGGYEPANVYEAQELILAGYLMGELHFTDRLKSTIGARVESIQRYFTGQSVDGLTRYKNTKVMDEINVLPSVGLIYSLDENQNLRFNFAQTLARPSFKEKSQVFIQDRISRRNFLGNIDAQQSEILNLDVRWEKFFNNRQMVSLSGYYKHFNNPLEVSIYDVTGPDYYTARNAKQGSIYGLELESRINLALLRLPNMNFGLNASYIYSEIEMNDEEYSVRKANAPEGYELSNMREMQGQSPYLINTFLSYKTPQSNWDFNLTYNVQGKRIAVVGNGQYPDIYDKPFNSLNFTVNHKFINNGIKLGFSVKNILDQERYQYAEVYDLQPNLSSSLFPGREFGINVSWSFKK